MSSAAESRRGDMGRGRSLRSHLDMDGELGMSDGGKLQRAVELTLAAGYQLDKEAFEFLNIIMATEDPAEVMSKAIKRLEERGRDRSSLKGTSWNGL